MIVIGVLLTLFYGIYVKRKEVGRGADTPERRIVLYAAFGIGAAFIGAGTIMLLFVS